MQPSTAWENQVVKIVVPYRTCTVFTSFGTKQTFKVNYYVHVFNFRDKYSLLKLLQLCLHMHGIIILLYLHLWLYLQIQQFAKPFYFHIQWYISAAYKEHRGNPLIGSVIIGGLLKVVIYYGNSEQNSTLAMTFWTLLITAYWRVLVKRIANS